MMCDLHDVGVSVGDNSTGESLPPRNLPKKMMPVEDEAVEIREQDFEPNIFIYDNYPGGIGLSPGLFGLEDKLLGHCLETIRACPCADGCPSCVGPTKESGEGAKKVAVEMLKGILERFRPEG